MKIVPASTFVPLGGRLQLPVTPANSGNPATRPFSALSVPESSAAESASRPQVGTGQSAPSSPGQPGAASHAPATLHIERDGDRVTHIEVRCGCGEVHRIACTY